MGFNRTTPWVGRAGTANVVLVPDRDELTLLPDRLRLPRGRSALPAEQVAQSQRGRVMQAVVEVVAERGYPQTSVQDVIVRARVSRKAFYDHFEDKQEAFAAAHLLASEQLLERVSAAVQAVQTGGWRGQLHAGVTAYLEGFVMAPAYATAFMVELLSAGHPLLDQRDLVLERYAANLAVAAHVACAGADGAAGRPEPSYQALIGAAGAADELTTREIRAGRFDTLPGLVEPIMEIHQAVITAGWAKDHLQ